MTTLTLEQSKTLTPEQQSRVLGLAKVGSKEQAQQLASDLYGMNPKGVTTSPVAPVATPPVVKTQSGTDLQGNVDTTLPAGAVSLSGKVTPAVVNIGGTPPKVETPTPTPTPTPVATPPIVEKTTTTTPQGETVVKKETPAPDMTKINEVSQQNRQNEVLTNLNEGYKNDPTINKAVSTGDYNTFKQAYSYDTADQTKKDTLDAFFQARQPKDANGIYQILKTGQTIANSAITQSADYTKAKAKFDMFSKFNGMDPNQLLTEMKNHNIGSEMDKELLLNPNYQVAKQKYNQYLDTKSINDKNQSLANSVVDKKNTSTDVVQNLSDSIVQNSNKTSEQLGTYRDYLAQNNPDLVAKVADLHAKNKSLKEMTDARDEMYKTVISEHPGISKASAIALAARLNEPLNEQIKSASYELDQLSSDIKYQQDIASKDYDYQMQQQETQQAQQFQRENILQQQDFQTKQFALQQSYANPDINSTNPEIARIALQDSINAENQFAQDNGIPIVRSTPEIIQQVQDYAKQNGVSMADAYQKVFIEPRHTSKEYQSALQNIQSNNAPTPKTPSIQKISDTQYGYFDASGNLVKIDANNPPPGTKDTTGFSSAIKADNGTVYGSCGKFANDFSGVGSEPGGDDTIAGRLKTYTDTSAVVGGMVFEAGPQLDAKNGHVAVVTSVNQDGSLQVKESNFFGDNKVHDRTIPASEVQSMVKGYYNNTPLANAQNGGTGGTNFDTNLIALYTKYNKGSFAGTDWSQLQDLGVSKSDFTKQATNYKGSLSNEGEGEIQKLINLANELKTDSGRTVAALGGGYIPFTDAANYQAKFDAFISSNALDNLVDLKSQGATFGALSDQELKFIKNASTSLKLNMSDKAFNDELDRIIEKLKKGVTNLGTTQDQSQGNSDFQSILDKYNN